uniref:Uncharacterized protein n=1 Tax=Lotharella globosa TaxID=91324 RepID=A0A7S3YT99_9EUKA
MMTKHSPERANGQDSSHQAPPIFVFFVCTTLKSYRSWHEIDAVWCADAGTVATMRGRDPVKLGGLLGELGLMEPEGILFWLTLSFIHLTWPSRESSLRQVVLACPVSFRRA